MGTSCFLNRIQKAQSMKEKKDDLYPLLRSLNLCVGCCGGSHCFVLCPLMLTHTLYGISDGVWITVQLPHSCPKPSSTPRFLPTFDSSGVIPAPAALSPHCTSCVPVSRLLSSHCHASHFILLLSCCSFCLPLLFSLEVSGPVSFFCFCLKVYFSFFSF